jgi:ribonuclease HII
MKRYLEAIPLVWLGDLPASHRLAGLDEVGRGSLAGPLVAAACVLPAGWIPEGLRDSKVMRPTARTRVAAELRARAEFWIAEISAAEIDACGMGWANRQILADLLERAGADLAIVDGILKLVTERPYRSVPRAERFAPVAAASVLAKDHRDRLMARLAAELPGRGLESAGYPTAANIAALRQHGPTIWHRRSFHLRSAA